MSFSDEQYMQRCLDLAKLGRLHAAPNPMVGSVIVHKGKIIGEGFHRKCGEAHAEVNAINAVKNPKLLKDSILYVNLEPCAHHGRTPACSKLIIDKQIPRVVIGCSDSFDKVNGKGIAMLRNAGVDVTVGVLENESRFLNRRFFTFYEKRRPYIILKWAQSQDGFIDFERSPDTPVGPNWITDEYARMLVHKWRAEETGIMVGTNTAEKDNPKLNVRDWSGKHPVRIVLDRSLRLDKNLALFDGEIPTIVFTEKEEISGHNLTYKTVSFNDDLFGQVFAYLYEQEIQSLIIEGGSRLINSSLDAGLWDEARVFTGVNRFISGVKAPIIKKLPAFTQKAGNSVLDFYFKTQEPIFSEYA